MISINSHKWHHYEAIIESKDRKSVLEALRKLGALAIFDGAILECGTGYDEENFRYDFFYTLADGCEGVSPVELEDFYDDADNKEVMFVSIAIDEIPIEREVK
jgi:hypothetical protein